MYKDNNIFKIFRAMAVGTTVGILFCSIMMVLLAFVLVKAGHLPTDAVYIMLQVIGAVSSFIGGYVAVRIYKSMGLAIGTATAFFMFIIVFIAGLASCSEGVTVMSLTKFVAMISAGAIGGILSVNKKKNVKKYR